MKKVIRHKTLNEVVGQCTELKMRFSYKSMVMIFEGGAHVNYEPRTGEFYGTTDTGEAFNSTIPKWNISWFEALCDFFWVREAHE
jgi:hypothetical protein